MGENLNKKRLYIVSRESVVEAGNLTKIDEEAAVLLVGRGLFLPPTIFNERGSKSKRHIYAIAEEVAEQGIGGALADSVTCLPAAEIVDLFLEYNVLNFG